MPVPRSSAPDPLPRPVPGSVPGPGRRAVLRTGLTGVAAAAVLGTAGCRLRVGSPQSAPSPRPVEPTLTADQLALTRACDRASALAASYADAARVRPDLAAGLRQLAADHSAHVQAIQALQPESTTTPTTSSTGSTGTSTPTSTSTGAPAGSVLTATTAVSALGQAERTASAAALADLASVGPQAARLLASIAGCGSAHVAVLAGLPARPRTKPVGTPSGAAR